MFTPKSPQGGPDLQGLEKVIASIRKSDNVKCWQELGERGPALQSKLEELDEMKSTRPLCPSNPLLRRTQNDSHVGP